MAAENKQSVGNGPVVENVQKSPSPDVLLGQLYDKDPKLFWFLKEAKNIQTVLNNEVSWDYLGAGQYSRYGVPIDIDVMVETIGGNPEVRLNEDSFLAIPLGNRSLIAVIDGASSQLPIKALTEAGVSGAFYISHLISHGFPQSELYVELCEKRDLSAKDVVVAINGWIREQTEVIEGVDFNDSATIPGAAATFALVDIGAGKISIAHIADTVAVQWDVSGAKVLTDNRNKVFDDETMKLVDEIMSQTGVTRDVAAKDFRVREQLRNSFRKKINTPNGCGILNGMPELVTNNLIQEENIDLGKIFSKEEDEEKGAAIVSQIILASDGFYTYFPKQENGDINPLQMIDFVDNLANFKYKEPKNVKEIRSVFLGDPLFEKIPRLKIADDITYVSLNFVVNRDEVSREHKTYPYGGGRRYPIPIGSYGLLGHPNK